MTKPIVDIDGLTLAYGGAAAVRNRNVPAIQVHCDTRLRHVHVPNAPFAAVHNGANLAILDSTNTTSGHAVVMENAGNVTVDGFTSKRISTGWGRKYAEGWDSIFGKRK
jgi:hypothetical protein